MKNRIFIAVEIPSEVKKKLEDYKEEISGLFEHDPVKWVEEECLHITLAFLGNMREGNLDSLCEELEKIEMKRFSVSLNEITYIPSQKRHARMIWIRGESEELQALYENVEKALVASKNVTYAPDNRAFSPHITLGRIRKWDWQRIPLSDIPDIGEEVDISFNVNFFQVMESKLLRGGPHYKAVTEYKLS